MRARIVVAPVLAATLLVLGGCVTVPSGPSVMVLPGTAKPFDVFRAEEVDCRNYAYAQMGGDQAAQQAQNNAVGSAAVGALIGAAAGAALGGPGGYAGQGAAIGAGTGLLFGSAAGSGAYNATSYEMQRRYDGAYVQCMYSKGNQVPVAAAPRGYQSPPPPAASAPPSYPQSYPQSYPAPRPY